MSRHYTQAEAKKLVAENRKLKKQIQDLLKITRSRRFKYAEKAASFANMLFPVDSMQREVIKKPYSIIKNQRYKKELKRIQYYADKVTQATQKEKRIIVLSSISWESQLKQRPHHLAQKFSKKGYFVIYLEHGQGNTSFRQITQNIITINDCRFIKDINTKNRECYFYLASTLLFPDLSVLKKLKKQGFKIIYDYIDEFHEDILGDLTIQLEIWQNLQKIQPVLCIATASKLQKQLVRQVGKRCPVVLAPNGVNVEHFNYKEHTPNSIPDDFKLIKKQKGPVIGYYGALAPWLNYKLIQNIAKKHQTWQFVLIGPDYLGARDRIAKLPNIHIIPAKDYGDLPQYTYYFDCAIIPFKHGNIAKATSPVKLYEYMANGLPVVCTRDLRECYGYDYVYIAEDNAKFEQYLQSAIKTKKNSQARERLLEQAYQNTWEQRVNVIDQALNEGVKPKSIKTGN